MGIQKLKAGEKKGQVKWWFLSIQREKGEKRI